MSPFYARATVNANVPYAEPRPFVLTSGGWVHADNPGVEPMRFASRRVARKVVAAWSPPSLFDRRDRIEVLRA